MLKVVLTFITCLLLQSSIFATLPYERMWQNTVLNYSEIQRNGIKKHQVFDYNKLAASQSFFALINQIRRIDALKLQKNEQDVFLINAFNIAVLQHYMHHNRPLEFKQRIPFSRNGFTFSDIIQRLRKSNILYLLCISDGNTSSPYVKAYSNDNFKQQFKEQRQNYVDRAVQIFPKDNKIKLSPWFKTMDFHKPHIVVKLLNLNPKIPYKVRYERDSFHLNKGKL